MVVLCWLSFLAFVCCSSAVRGIFGEARRLIARL
jgi:hypothetical protein